MNIAHATISETINWRVLGVIFVGTPNPSWPMRRNRNKRINIDGSAIGLFSDLDYRNQR